MKTSIFDFHVPSHLIAQTPAQKRSDSRLLVYYREQDRIVDSFVNRITDFIDDQSFLVFNNSRVIPSRVFITKKKTGRPGELLVLKIIDCHQIEVITDKSKKYKKGTVIILPDQTEAEISSENQGLQKIVYAKAPVFKAAYFEKYGHMPLPPYIKKKAGQFDRERYQTIYSKEYGSAAAPTAGLHFDQKIFSSLEKKQIDYSFISLHVGLGTFQPIYSDLIEDHIIHQEEYSIAAPQALKINRAISRQKKILPVGTTSLRTLETAYQNGQIKSGPGTSNLYIYPSYEFKICSGLFTNFHTPKSSLIVLVAAMVGVDQILSLYQHAVKQEYRFFSYGDSMLII